MPRRLSLVVVVVVVFVVVVFVISAGLGLRSTAARAAGAVGGAVAGANADVPAPVYIWLEPEWFPGVKGDFNYWTGKAKPIGSWGIAGPGLTAEWSQGGESEWQSM